jgi:hypothetical protein
MALPITVPNTFAGATAAIPLSQLDSNFTAVVNGVNGIGNGTNSLANVSITGGSISNVSVSSANVTITGGTLNAVNVTNAAVITGTTITGTTITGTNFSSGNVTITGGTINATNVTNSAVITGTSITGTNFSSGNVTITGGSINNASVTNAVTLTTANVTITGGSISNVTLSNVATAPTNGYLRNRIINGAMQVDQRNNGSQSSGIASGSQIYTLDRWIFYVSSVTAGTMFTSRYALSPAGGPQNQYLIQVGATGTAFLAYISQRIEQLNCYDLAGKTATLSFDWLTPFGGNTSIAWTAYYANTVNTFGTFASPTKTQIATGAVNTTSSIATYTVSFSVPSAATTGIEITFTINDSTGSLYYLGNVQLEVGGNATPFERRSYGETLALCSRYYQKLGAYVPAAQAMFSFPTVMRAAPTIAGGGTGYSSPNIYTNGVGHSQTAAASQTAMTFTAEL